MSSSDVPQETGAAEQEPPATRGMHRGPLAVAGVVLLLWLAWLLVPEGAKQDLRSDPVVAEDLQVRAAVGAAGRPEADPTVASSVDPSVDPSPNPSAEPEPERSAGPVASGQAEPSAAQPAVEQPAAAASASVVPEVPAAGTGEFAVVPGTSARTGSGALVRYTVEIEGGLPLDGAEVAAFVDATLADPRSWTARGEWALERVDSAGDARIRLASPATTDALCAPLDTAGRFSCRNGDDVVLNAIRWTEGAESWGADLAGYRGYLVNHEFGHYLGNGHVGCSAPGQPAPVMMQQTKTVGECLPNSWPYP